jgi:hypothetical protein
VEVGGLVGGLNIENSGDLKICGISPHFSLLKFRWVFDKSLTLGRNKYECPCQ